MIVKVVYNLGYGGFGLSRRAIEWMAERGHPQVIDYMTDPCWIDEGEGKPDGWLCPTRNELLRHDPLLVAVVEELGSKEASYRGSCLKVVEIEGNKYEITGCDGWEGINTPESMSWVVVKEN